MCACIVHESKKGTNLLVKLLVKGAGAGIRVNTDRVHVLPQEFRFYL